MSAVLKRAAPVAAQPFSLRCPDGRQLSAHWIPAGERRAVLVINAGTGFPQTFYMRLAGYAAGRGYDTLVYDYRGMGMSAPPDLAAETARMSEWGLLDMRTALSAAAERAAGVPLATLGHSIGGQFLGLLTNHALARAHVQVAASVGYWPWEHAPFKYLAWWFWRVHGPLLLGTGLALDVAVHLLMTPAALARRLDPDERWTLPAYDRYATEVAPETFADVVVRADDPDHPAVSTDLGNLGMMSR